MDEIKIPPGNQRDFFMFDSPNLLKEIFSVLNEVETEK